MRLRVVAVGRAKDGPARTLFADYARRLPWRLDLVEVEAKGRGLKPKERKAREAVLLLKAVPEDAYLIALDARGRALSSEAFARKLHDLEQRRAGSLAFALGGAEGLDGAVLGRADFILSLGPMTWPHLIARVMLVEQLYRAASISRGHPYHRG